MRLIPLILLSAFLAAAVPARADWRAVVEKEIGKQGISSGNVLKFEFPRSDMAVKVGNVKVKPELALTSWFTLRNEGALGTAVMGDLALKEEEVGPVMARLLKDNIWVTASGNHLMFEKPRVMFVHFGSRGKTETMARAMKGVLRLTATPLTAKTPARAGPADWKKVEAVLGKGTRDGDVIHFNFQRADTIKELGTVIPPLLGVKTEVSFQKDGSKDAVAGYYALEPDEVNPVIADLLGNGISVTAVHSNMLFEDPRLIFVYVWGYGEPEKLAKGIKAALGQANYKR
jgi:Domain of Unknown Function (DUF1259)